MNRNKSTEPSEERIWQCIFAFRAGLREENEFDYDKDDDPLTYMFWEIGDAIAPKLRNDAMRAEYV